MKRYILTAVDIQSILQDLIKNVVDSGILRELLLRETIKVDVIIDHVKEIPDWATHFYGGDKAFMSPAASDRYEEIPK